MFFPDKFKAALLCLVLLATGCTASRTETLSPQTTGSTITSPSSATSTSSSDSNLSQNTDTQAQSTSNASLTSSITPKKAPSFPANSPAALHGKLHVKDTYVADQNEKPFQLRGISTHGIEWYGQFINEKCFKHLRDEWKINVIRLAMYTDDDTAYQSDKTKFHNLVRKGVDIASGLGLYVVVDWHILSDGNPVTHKEDAKNFFNEMAQEYANYPNVIFEICNEPNGNDVSWDKEIKPYAEELTDVIRTADNDAIIIVGTPTWCQNTLAAARNPLKDTNTMYALHFYANTHTTMLRDYLSKSITKYHLPVFVSEFGTCSSSGDGDVNIKESDLWLNLLNSNQISWINWSLSDKQEAASLLKPGASIDGGWKDDELTTSGKYIKAALTK